MGVASTGIATMAGLGLAMGAISTGVAVYGQMQQGDAAQAQANYQAQVAANNQLIGNRNAETALHAGMVQEQNARMKTASLIGSQATVAAANGLDPNSGSPLKLQEDSAKMGELDAETIRNNAARQAWNDRARANNFQAQSGLYQLQGDNASTISDLYGIGGMLSGASNFAEKWNSYSQQ